DGSMIEPPFEILSLERGDAVAALIHDVSNNTVVLVEQFRYPTLGKGTGWIFEVVAGMLKSEENPRHAIRREIFEEVGYKITSLKEIATFFVSPGGSSERIVLYYVAVTANNLKAAAGGLASESENIRRHAVPLKTAFSM